MRAPRFKKWFAGLPALNQPQRRQVLAALLPAAGLDRLLALLDQRRPDRRYPTCASPHWHRHGQANGLQRYRCRAYRRTFDDLSGTPLARLRRREKWIGCLGALLESLPVRAAAQRVGVRSNTAFLWRHRFLTRVKDDRPPAPAWHLRGGRDVPARIAERIAPADPADAQADDWIRKCCW